MTIPTIPHFTIKNRFQKGGEYQDVLTPAILSDVCLAVTGKVTYTVDFDNEGYNIGRLAILEFNGKKSYISFSEIDIRSRNSSFQSLPSALSRFILDSHPNKEICFYFHPSIHGNYETGYFRFMYRLMKTANIVFLNDKKYLKNPVTKFSTAEDLILHKEKLRSRNLANASTFVTQGPMNQLQIYGKTYGANKYETTILCMAIGKLANPLPVELYQIGEGGLKILPNTSKRAIESLGNVTVFESNKLIEKKDFEQNDSLRSIEYIYNLLDKLGKKSCFLCKCSIPQVIQGAHIWPVAEIKRQNHLTEAEKLAAALDGDNGIWLCQNHHKLFDLEILRISNDGSVMFRKGLASDGDSYISEITKKHKIPNQVLNKGFTHYLSMRNKPLDENLYSKIP